MNFRNQLTTDFPATAEAVAHEWGAAPDSVFYDGPYEVQGSVVVAMNPEKGRSTEWEANSAEMAVLIADLWNYKYAQWLMVKS